MSQQPTSPIYLRPVDPQGQEPFSGDLFDRKQLAEQLTGYLSRLPEGGVFAIDAPWGEGKSWFGRHWHAYLHGQGYKVIYLDAFQRDYIEDPFLMISGEILSALKDGKPEVRQNVLDAGKKVGKALLPMAAKVAIGAAGRLILGSADIMDDIKKVGESVQEETATALERQIERRLNEYESDKQSVEGFRDALAELAKTSDKPIVVFVDELDRCRPDFSVKTIERIKHFFDVPGLVFVLLLNREQLAESVKGVYGAGLNADAYLGKFIQFSLALPKRKSFDSPGRDDNRHFCQKILGRYGFPSMDANDGFATTFGAFASLMGLSFRDIERGVILFSIAQPINNSSMYLAWPIAMKLARPSLFQGIADGRRESHREAKELLGSMKAQVPDFWVLPILEELHDFHATGQTKALGPNAAQGLSGLGRWSTQPGELLPWLCKRIDLALRD